jgi:hypothetical protein
MPTVQSYFQAGRFVTDTPVQIPEGKKTIVMVLDEDNTKEGKAYQMLWDEIIDEIENSDEVLEGEPDQPGILQRHGEERVKWQVI